MKNNFSSLFPETLHYHLEKIFEGIYRSELAELGKINVDVVREVVIAFQSALSQKGLLERYEDTVATEINEALYPLDELLLYLTGGSSRLNQKDALIFLDYIREKMENLQGMAKEIDSGS